MGLTAAVLADEGGGDALNTTVEEERAFWESREGLVEKGTLPLFLYFLLVTVVKEAFSTTSSSTAISTSGDDSSGKLEL